MISKPRDWGIILRVSFLFVTLLVVSFFIIKEQWLPVAYISPFVILALIYLYRYQKRIQNEVEQFVEAVHYRDFTRNFAWQNSPTQLKSLRKGFNEINSAFKEVSREKEAQYLYLQKILELINTGILSYETQNGDIIWINDALKNLLNVPYIKNIHLLDNRDHNLLDTLLSIKNGEGKIINLEKDHAIIKVLVNATAFQTEGKIYKLIAFQNVNEALDETESRAWQKLLSVMTHEIMNSIAPIASLADTLKKRLQYKDNPAFLDDMELGIDTIKRRSEGLTKFAETYRNLSKIYHLDRTDFLVRNLFETIYQLMHPTLQQKNIELEIMLRDTQMALKADRNLLEQILINLVLNAVEAVKERAEAAIILSASIEDNRPVIAVTDNGKGIETDLLDKIFIPFFSTRKNGNGIGLSLCKQMMMVHGGNIQVHTREGKGTSFRLIFGPEAQ